jgi:regulator of nonsense transcripts 1
VGSLLNSSSNGGSSGSSGGYSYFNEAEAAVVVDCLRQLLAAGMQPQDVCVVTPYSGQVRSIQRLLSLDSKRPGERRVLDAAVASMVEVRSVDGFQGREKEVVIFSAVRSNSRGRVGFLSDSRRLNVALTRAKRGLVVVGDAATLRSDRVWSAWLAWAKKHGAVAGSAESM